MGHTHGAVWTKELIAQKIMEAVNGMNLSVMPTRGQFYKFYGDDKLTNKISKSLGYYGWAKRLGLPVQANDTRKAKLSEKFIADLLQSKGYIAKQMLTNYPFDILINGVVRADVKFANLSKGDGGNYYSFALRKKYPTCDIYILVANSEPKKIYFVPACKCIQTQIGIGEHSSKYDKYLDRYDIIDQYLKLYSEIA